MQSTNVSNILFIYNRISHRWKEYLEKLYEMFELEKEINEDDRRDEIVRDEFDYALKKISDEKESK